MSKFKEDKAQSELQYCFQVNYMSLQIHKYILVEWGDYLVRFKWKQDNRWHKGTDLIHRSDSVWFKSLEEAALFVSDNYATHFGVDLYNLNKKKSDGQV